MPQVTDPSILAQLNGAHAPAAPAAPGVIYGAPKVKDPLDQQAKQLDIESKQQALGKAGQEQQKDTAEKAQKVQDAMEATRQLLHGVRKAKAMVSGWSTGVGGWLGQELPWDTQANQLETTINQEVRGNIFQKWVAMMKANTDTGTTGIGRILQSEIPLVTGAQGALDPVKLGEEKTKANLDQIAAGALRSAALLNHENPDDPKVIQKYYQQFFSDEKPSAAPPATIIHYDANGNRVK